MPNKLPNQICTVSNNKILKVHYYNIIFFSVKTSQHSGSKCYIFLLNVHKIVTLIFAALLLVYFNRTISCYMYL